jgi:hypothetical protein
MASAVTDVTQLNGLYKQVYGELQVAIPQLGEILQEIEFKTSELLGKEFVEPVILSNEHGYSYGGTGGGAFDLIDPIAMASDDALIAPYSYMMQSAMSYTAASRASRAGNTAQAFAKAVTVVIERAMEASAYRLGISCLYGQSPNGIGRVLATAVVDVTGTTHDWVFTEANWAPGIWSGAEGAQLNVHRGDNGNKIGTNGTTDTIFQVVSVNNSTRTVRVSSTAQGIIDAETANDTVDLVVYFRDSKANDFPGMEFIFSNTTGTVHGINASTFGLWAGNTFAVGGQLTKGKVLQYVANLVGRGLKEDVVCRVSCNTWGNLEQDEIALQVFDQSYNPNRAESGVEAIWYRGQNGRIEVRSDSCVKGGDAFIYPKRRMRRLGSADRDMAIPGQDAEPFFPLAGKAGFSWRNLSDQALYMSTPARAAYLSGIINS